MSFQTEGGCMTESLKWTACDLRRQSWPARLASGCRSSGFSPRWVPESARWLLTQGRVEEARKYLFDCARLNGRPVGEDGLSQEVRVHRGGWRVCVRVPLLLGPPYVRS